MTVKYDPSSGFHLLPDMDGYDEAVSTPPPDERPHWWDGTKWVLDDEAALQELTDAIQSGVAAIDSAVIAVYAPITPLLEEYKERERQAKEYAARDFVGDVPSQVAAFAVPAGITSQQATQIILNQAAAMHAALEALGKLRMRKVHLPALTTVDGVQYEVSATLAAIKTIAEQMQ